MEFIYFRSCHVAIQLFINIIFSALIFGKGNFSSVRRKGFVGQFLAYSGFIAMKTQIPPITNLYNLCASFFIKEGLIIIPSFFERSNNG